MVEESELREAEYQAGRECDRLLAEIERLQAENARFRVACEAWLETGGLLVEPSALARIVRLTRGALGK